MKDYSQYGEQEAILKGLSVRGESVLPGRFLDIGAWHPTEFSNTRALFELGWSGVMIEPSPGPMLNLLDAYGNEPRVTLIQAAVSVTTDPLSMMVTDDAVSTSDEVQYGVWKDAAKYRGRLVVPTITPGAIATRYGGFDFVNIDAEGESARIFLHMLELGLFPPCVCVEHDSQTTILSIEATKHNYRVVLVNSTNMVLVR